MGVNYKELKQGGFMRQRQPNYFSMRLKSVGGHFTSEQLCTIQRAAEIFGKSYIHLTSRQGIEIPFIHLDDIAEVKKFLAEGGVEPNWNAENCIYCGVCQAVCPEKAIVVDKKSKTVERDENKCVYCGKCIKSCPVEAWQGKSGFVISFGGLYGNRIAVGKNILPIVFDDEKLFAIVEAALNFFENNAKAGERFRNMLDRIGWENFTTEISAVAK